MFKVPEFVPRLAWLSELVLRGSRCPGSVSANFMQIGRWMTYEMFNLLQRRCPARSTVLEWMLFDDVVELGLRGSWLTARTLKIRFQKRPSGFSIHFHSLVLLSPFSDFLKSNWQLKHSCRSVCLPDEDAEPDVEITLLMAEFSTIGLRLAETVAEASICDW